MAGAFMNAVNNIKLTENGALAYKSSLSACVDFFATCGSLRERSDSDIVKLFDKAYNEDAEIALRTLVYCRDIRNGGCGERRTYRVIARHLIDEGILPLDAFADISVEYGYWDDIFSVCNDIECGYLVRREFVRRIDNKKEHPSFLMEKWMPSIGGKDNARAERLARFLNLTPREYRKYLAKARGANGANIPEAYMCRGDWSNIVYEKNPSYANLKYRKAFLKHDGQRYQGYLNNVKKGNTKVNASTLFPYDIVRKLFKSRFRSSQAEADALDVLWKNIKNYECDGNSIVVCDTSGSMTSNDYLPISTAISLGIYFAERNVGKFHGQMITFSSRPSFIEIDPNDSIRDKVKEVKNSDWGFSTDINKVFSILLDTCRYDNVPAEEMPKRVIIVSDMEFDSCVDGGTNFDRIKADYAEYGYELPELIFWNVNARNTTMPVRITNNGTALVSGHSPSLFEHIASCEKPNPIKMMLNTIMRPCYDFAMDAINRKVE